VTFITQSRAYRAHQLKVWNILTHVNKTHEHTHSRKINNIFEAVKLLTWDICTFTQQSIHTINALGI